MDEFHTGDNGPVERTKELDDQKGPEESFLGKYLHVNRVETERLRGMVINPTAVDKGLTKETVFMVERDEAVTDFQGTIKDLVAVVRRCQEQPVREVDARTDSHAVNGTPDMTLKRTGLLVESEYLGEGKDRIIVQGVREESGGTMHLEEIIGAGMYREDGAWSARIALMTGRHGIEKGVIKEEVEGMDAEKLRQGVTTQGLVEALEKGDIVMQYPTRTSSHLDYTFQAVRPDDKQPPYEERNNGGRVRLVTIPLRSLNDRESLPPILSRMIVPSSAIS